MSGKTKVFKTRQRKVAPKKNVSTKPKAFKKETGLQLQDFPDHSISNGRGKGPVDQSFLVPSGLFGKEDFVDLALCVAYLNIYTKDDRSNWILHALTSKLRDEFVAEKQHVDGLEHSLQQSKEENKDLAKNLIQVFRALRHNQKETEHLKNELENIGLRIGDKKTPENLKHKDERKASEYDTLWRGFHQEKETSQTQTQIYGQRDIGLRGTKLKDNIKSNQKVDENTILELRHHLKQTLEELEKTKVMLNEAMQGQEFEEAQRKTLDQTVRENMTHIEMLKGECIKLSLSREELNEHYLAELSKAWTAFEQARNEKDYALRQEQAAEMKATDLFNQSKILEQEIKRQDQKIEKMTKMIKSQKNNLSVENQLKMDLLEKEKHQILIDKKNAEAKLGEFRSKYETEKRKCQELQRQVSDYRIKSSMLKSENKKGMKSEKEEKRLLARLRKNVEEKDRTNQTLKKSLEEFKSDNSKLRLEISDSKVQFSDKVTQLQQSLEMLKEAKDELQKTKNERDREYVQRNTIEKKVRELEEYNESSEKAKLKRLEEIHVKRDTDNLRKELETKDEFLKLKREHELVVTKLKETEEKLGEANNEIQIEYRTREELESKTLELKACIRDLREENQHLENKVKLKDSNLQVLEVSLESLRQKSIEKNQQWKIDSQRNVEQLSELKRREEAILEELNKARLELDKNKSETEIEKSKVKELERRLETELEHTNSKLKRYEEIQVKSDSDNLRNQLETTKHQFLKLKHEHELVVKKLKETEEKLDQANDENQIEHRTKRELKSKALELENCIIDLREANQHLENEIILKDSNLQALQVSLESLKQKGIENKRNREIDFQNNFDQLSELRRREKSILEELTNARLELDKNKSETEIEKRKVKELEKRVNGYENQIKQSKDENDEIFRIRNQRLSQLEEEVKKRDREIEDLTKSLEQIKHQNIEQGKQMHTLTDTKEHLRNQLQIAESQLQETAEREHDVTKELKRKHKEYEDGAKHLEQINKHLTSQKQRIQHLEKETVCKDQKIKVLKQSLENANREIIEKNKLMQDLKETKDNLISTRNQQKQVLANLKETEAELEEVKTANDDLQSKLNAVSELRDQLLKALSKLEKTEIELEETKTRLSKAMGDKLTDNNPNIADLSDKNRPVKLAERYSELYDNQWTDAYDVLEKRFEREQHTIESLLEILQDASHFCVVNAVKQLEDLQRGLLFTKTAVGNFPTSVLKLLKDCRKRMSSTAIKDLYEMYLSHLKMSHPEILKNAKDISEFVRECLELCWLMAIQDPPVVFAPVAQPGSDFNTDLFKAYTSSGKHVDYTVWPAMLLHKGGPILSKGIAQGYGKKTSKAAKQ